MALFINGVGQDTFSMNGVTIDNLYVDGVLVWSIAPVITDDPPIYLMTEPINDTGSQFEVVNSATSGDKWNGVLEHHGDGGTGEGVPWYPIPNINDVYPQDGTINLVVTGDGTRQIDTQWIAPQNTEWTIIGIYNVVMGVSYDMYAIHYKTGDLCDIYKGDQDTPIALTESDKPYTPPTESWVIEDNPPEIIGGDVIEVYVSYSAGTTSEAMPDGIYINDLPNMTIDIPNVMMDKDNVATEVTITHTVAADSTGNGGTTTSNNSGCMYDYQLKEYHFLNASGQDTMVESIYLPAGTYNISVVGARLITDTRIAEYTLGSYGTVTLDACLDGGNTQNCVGWTDVVSTGEAITLTVTVQEGSTYAYLNGLNIISI